MESNIIMLIKIFGDEKIYACSVCSHSKVGKKRGFAILIVSDMGHVGNG